MTYAAAVFFVFLCVVFSTSAHAFFFFFHNRLVLFSAKLRTPFCNWVAKEGKGIAAAKHGLKIQQSHAPERWPYSLRVRGPHFASKVSYNAGAATDDNASALPSYYFLANALLHSIASRPAFDCVSSHVRSCLGPRSLKSIGTETRKTLLRKKRCTPENSDVHLYIYISRSEKLRRMSLRHQHLLSVDEVDALRQGNEARAFHISVVERDA